MNTKEKLVYSCVVVFLGAVTVWLICNTPLHGQAEKKADRQLESNKVFMLVLPVIVEKKMGTWPVHRIVAEARAIADEVRAQSDPNWKYPDVPSLRGF